MKRLILFRFQNIKEIYLTEIDTSSLCTSLVLQSIYYHTLYFELISIGGVCLPTEHYFQTQEE